MEGHEDGNGPVDLVVLAGGASRRMGTDKAVVRDREGRRLVDVVLARLAPLGGRVVIARGARPALTGLADDVVQVADVPGLAGPVGGLLAGLRATTTPWAAAVAVDLPAASAAVLRAAVAVGREHGGAPVVVPLDADGRPQWLHAVWPTPATLRLAQVTTAEPATVAVSTAVGPRLGAVVDAVGWVPLPAEGSTPWARNVNRPEDLHHP